MSSGLYIVVVLGLAMVIGLAIVVVIIRLDPLLRGRMRSTRSLRELAAMKGLRFDRSDQVGLLSLPLDRIRGSKAGRCQNVLSIESGARERFRVFELFCEEWAADLKEFVKMEYTCALASIDANCPMLKIVRRYDADGDELELPEESLIKRIRVDDPAFTKAFVVYARDERIASAVLDKQVRSWLIAQPKRWDWEIHDAFVFGSTPGILPPNEAVEAIRTVRQLVDELPADLETTYPPGPTEMDKRADVALAEFRGGTLPAAEAADRIESGLESADSLADQARYKAMVEEVTGGRTRRAVSRVGRGREV
jgi:hypothetical protein